MPVEQLLVDSVADLLLQPPPDLEQLLQVLHRVSLVPQPLLPLALLRQLREPLGPHLLPLAQPLRRHLVTQPPFLVLLERPRKPRGPLGLHRQPLAQLQRRLLVVQAQLLLLARSANRPLEISLEVLPLPRLVDSELLLRSELLPLQPVYLEHLHQHPDSSVDLQLQHPLVVALVVLLRLGPQPLLLLVAVLLAPQPQPLVSLVLQPPPQLLVRLQVAVCLAAQLLRHKLAECTEHLRHKLVECTVRLL